MYRCKINPLTFLLFCLHIGGAGGADCGLREARESISDRGHYRTRRRLLHVIEFRVKGSPRELEKRLRG